MTRSILVLNGPNLNLLGKREPGIYGRETLSDIEAAATKRARELGLTLEFRQSNSEGQLVDWVQSAEQTHGALIVNAGAYSHTSIALLDALRGCGLPVIEVHLSNIFRREAYRHHSYVSEVAQGVICGFGGRGYVLAVEAAAVMLDDQAP